ncbi:MAG: hypothetical protein ACRDOU_27200 [Streptosporangiaceae bacterium]
MGRGKKRVFAGLAALALAGGAFAALGPGASAASSASSACGSSCLSLYAQSFGTADAGAVPAAAAGKPQYVVLSAAADTESEDFEADFQGTVTEFCNAGIMTGVVCTTWPNNSVYEYEYTPGNVHSGLCIGTAAPAVNGTKVSLQTCGVNADTTWILLPIDTIGRYEPLIAGTDTVQNTPEVLTAGSAAGDKLTTRQLDLVDGTFDPAQMWQTVSGVL